MDNRFLNTSSSSSSSSSTSSDENNQTRRPRLLLNRRNPITEYDNVDFKNRFRFTKECCEEILNLIGNNLKPASNRNKPVNEMNQLLITLRFYATGSFQICTGDHFNISKSTVCRIIRNVTHHITALRPQFIQLPQNRDELTRVQNDFFQIAGFPRVLGAIDCTHIKIQSPGGADGEIYRNRKGWFSINVQAVCDAKLKFMNLVARWSGSVHDSTIFNNSMLRASLENHEYPNHYLLGDSGYACRSFLLTPLLNPITPSENAYNYAHIRTRNVIERAFGVLKRRFPCLSIGLRTRLQTTLSVIVATTILHNIATQKNDDPNDIEYIEIPFENPDNDIAHNENDNIAVRTALINTVFRR